MTTSIIILVRDRFRSVALHVGASRTSKCAEAYSFAPVAAPSAVIPLSKAAQSELFDTVSERDPAQS